MPEKTHRLARRLALVFACAGAAGQAQAAVLTVFGDLGAFSAAAGGSLLTQDFSGYASGANLAGVEIVPGLRVTTNMDTLTQFAGAMFGQGGRASGHARYDIALTLPYRFVAFDIGGFEQRPGVPSMAQGPGLLSVTFADATSTDLAIAGNATGTPVFIGLEADTAIAAIRWTEAIEGGGGSEETTLDNFRVAPPQPARVPEPAMPALLAAAFAVAAVQRRRAQSTASQPPST